MKGLRLVVKGEGTYWWYHLMEGKTVWMASNKDYRTQRGAIHGAMAMSRRINSVNYMIPIEHE